MGLERAVVAPYERPIEPATGISSEEVKWSPDGRYVIGGEFIEPPSLLYFLRLSFQPHDVYTNDFSEVSEKPKNRFDRW